jgi:hypothetical protein
MLKLALKKQDMRMWTVFIWLRTGRGPLADCCIHSGETSGTLKGQHFYRLNEYRFLTKDSTALGYLDQ